MDGWMNLNGCGRCPGFSLLVNEMERCAGRRLCTRIRWRCFVGSDITGLLSVALMPVCLEEEQGDCITTYLTYLHVPTEGKVEGFPLSLPKEKQAIR